MWGHDAADDPLCCEPTNPIDLIEAGEDEADESASIEQQITLAERRSTRDAAIKYVSQIYCALSFILEPRTHEEVATRALIVASAFQHPKTRGKSDWDLASMCNTSRANFAKHQVTYQRQSSLPQKPSQKSNEARQAYSEARKEQLNEQSA